MFEGSILDEYFGEFDDLFPLRRRYDPNRERALEKKDEIEETVKKYAETYGVNINNVRIRDLPKWSILDWFTGEKLGEGKVGGLNYGGIRYPWGEEIRIRGQIELDKEDVAKGDNWRRSLEEEISHEKQKDIAIEENVSLLEEQLIKDLTEGQVAYFLGTTMPAEDGSALHIYPKERNIYEKVIQGEIPLEEYLRNKCPFYYHRIDIDKLQKYLNKTHEIFQEMKDNGEIPLYSKEGIWKGTPEKPKYKTYKIPIE